MFYLIERDLKEAFVMLLIQPELYLSCCNLAILVCKGTNAKINLVETMCI